MSREQRRLAAILAADVVGYSRLMGRDEAGTLARLREHRRQRFEPTLARHGGRLVKLTGDGALAEFPSAVNALSAAIEFQQSMAEANRDQPEDAAIVFRIGLHLGDLIVEGDDLYGDGVNVAARLEAEAPAGGIVISRTVHEAVVRKLKASFEDLGSLALKNIDQPVQAFRVDWQPADWAVTMQPVVPAAAAALPGSDKPLALPDKPSIAVLPFQNMSGDPEQEYFADGVVEDIISALSRFKSLFVIARNSTFAYKGKSLDIRQVGRELGVRYVLEGSVRKAGGRVRITGQLIDSATGAHLWADRFEGSLDDIFELQDQVTASVVGAIAPKLDEAEIERTRRKPVENLDAYDLFLRGLAVSYVWTKESVEEALRLFYRSIELDPEFSAPYGLAARCYVIRKSQGWVVDQEWEKAEIRRLALRVSVVGRDDALALTWVGHGLVFVCRDYDTGAALVDQALSINQNLAVGWTNRGLVSVFLGQHDAAIEQFGRALRLSPRDSETYRTEGGMAFALLFLGRYAEAVNWTTRALAHRAGYVPIMRTAAAANALAGNLEDAQKVMEEVRKHDPLMRISHLGERYTTYRRAEDNQRMIEGLRLAGLPQ